MKGQDIWINREVEELYLLLSNTPPYLEFCKEVLESKNPIKIISWLMHTPLRKCVLAWKY